MRIAEVVAHPLTMPIAPGEHRTHWGDYPSLSILVVELRTDAGLVGWGEGLVRRCPEAYATIVRHLLHDELLGANPFHVGKIWQRLYARFHGKVGHAIPEAVAAVDKRRLKPVSERVRSGRIPNWTLSERPPWPGDRPTPAGRCPAC